MARPRVLGLIYKIKLAKLDLIKTENFCAMKDPTNSTKRGATEQSKLGKPLN